MFEVNGQYANRRGTYTVLSLDGSTMSVRYEDGSEVNLNVDIQYRIWENILVEQGAEDKRNAKKSKKKVVANAHHYIKVVSIAPGDELAFPGWEERVIMVLSKEQAKLISKEDRLIFYSPEAQTFFAVATITGEPFEANPKKYTFTVPEKKAAFFQIDVDADTGSLARGVTLESVELESCPDFSGEPVPSETFCPISEDDFELLAELLVEISEGDIDDDTDSVDDEEDFDEDDE